MITSDSQYYHKRNLPHFQPEYGYFAIVFRLAFTLPESVITEMLKDKNEFNRLIKDQSHENIAKLKEEYGMKSFDHFDSCLASIDNSIKWLSDDRIAKIVADSIHFPDHKIYDLIAYCIMPNHVHLIIKPLQKSQDEFYKISEIMRSLKGFTSRKCKVALDTKDQFWQKEYYDHFIRNESDFNNQMNYLVLNPVKAGLTDDWEKWPYTFVKEDFIG